MNKIVTYENSYININEENRALLDDLIEIGYQLKNELGLRNNPIQSVSANSVYIGNIIGNIALNTTNLVIKPKYLNAETPPEESYRYLNRLFTRTIKCASSNLNSTIFFLRNNIIDEENDFFDILAMYYLDITTQAVRQSKICTYVDRVEKVRTIKGRILVQRQLSRPMMDEKTWCKYKQLTDNNIYNQLLFWCCKYLVGLATNMDLKRKLMNLSREFPQETALLNRYDVSRLRQLRQFKEYDESIQVAKSLFLDTASKQEQLGAENRICGYAINMERSFQNIVSYYLSTVADRMGCTHKDQATRKLTTCQDGEGFNFHVIPDDVITKRNSTLILDAKYKTISIYEKGKAKPSREDFYQMVSSCLAYNCHEAILIYPMGNGFIGMRWDTDNTVNDYKYIIRSRGIDLDVKDEELIKQLSEIVKGTLFFEEVFGE